METIIKGNGLTLGGGGVGGDGDGGKGRGRGGGREGGFEECQSRWRTWTEKAM